MSTAKLAALLVCMTLPGAVHGQSGTINLAANPQPFSHSDFETLVACSLEKHPDESKRYATYHLLRRNVQTPEQNEADPDSKLMLPAMKGCFEFKNGHPIPFSLDQLISRWGSAHGVSQAVIVTDEASLAKCAVRNHKGTASAFVQVMADPSQKLAVRRMLATSLTAPPCEPAPNTSLSLTQLVGHLRAVLQNGEATN